MAQAIIITATVVLDLLLIPEHGAFGAALASTIAYTAGGAAIAVVFCRVLEVRPGALVPRFRDLTAAVADVRGRLRQLSRSTGGPGAEGGRPGG